MIDNDEAEDRPGSHSSGPDEPAIWTGPMRSGVRPTSEFSPPVAPADPVPDRPSPQPPAFTGTGPGEGTRPAGQQPFVGATPSEQFTGAPLPQPARPRATAPLYLVAVIGAAAFILGCLVGWGTTSITTHLREAAATAAASHVLEDAYTSCSSPYGITVGDNGKSMAIDTQGAEDASGASLTDAACVLGALEVPDYILTQIDSTRALDGTQSAEWNGLAATWNYHPDSGMTMSIHVGDTSGSNS